MFSGDHMRDAASELVAKLKERYPDGIPTVRIHKVTNRTRHSTNMTTHHNALANRLGELGVPIAVARVDMEAVRREREFSEAPAPQAAQEEARVGLIISGGLTTADERKDGARVTRGSITLRATDPDSGQTVTSVVVAVTEEEPLEDE
jgi:hypothetical protein